MLKTRKMIRLTRHILSIWVTFFLYPSLIVKNTHAKKKKEFRLNMSNNQNKNSKIEKRQMNLHFPDRIKID